MCDCQAGVISAVTMTQWKWLPFKKRRKTMMHIFGKQSRGLLLGCSCHTTLAAFPWPQELCKPKHCNNTLAMETAKNPSNMTRKCWHSSSVVFQTYPYRGMLQKCQRTSSFAFTHHRTSHKVTGPVHFKWKWRVVFGHETDFFFFFTTSSQRQKYNSLS